MAQIGLMNVLAVEAKEHSILVNAISPVAKTPMWNIQEEPEDLQPEQVAPKMLYLASPECQESGFILRASNGQFTARFLIITATQNLQSRLNRSPPKLL